MSCTPLNLRPHPRRSPGWRAPARGARVSRICTLRARRLEHTDSARASLRQRRSFCASSVMRRQICMTTALFAASRTHATNIHAQHIYTQRSYIHKAHTNTALFYITHNTTHIDADFFCRRWFPDFVALLKSKGVAPATEPLATVRCPPLRLARVSVCLCLCVFCRYVRLCVMLRRFSGNISLSIPHSCIYLRRSSPVRCLTMRTG